MPHEWDWPQRRPRFQRERVTLWPRERFGWASPRAAAASRLSLALGIGLWKLAAAVALSAMVLGSLGLVCLILTGP
jgi:hypothetical protein